VFVSDLLKDWDPGAIRLGILGNSYRQEYDWTSRLLESAARRLDAWRGAGAGDGALDDVRAALDDDLDTPRAIAAIDDAASSGKGVSQAAALLGVQL
jgi:L-cysteine:1D-myo-inositol 2-amino-2-deoxy-alpha-D-glucopyranoside ligase